MYKGFFGINESPFSIVPSARFLYLSERHREALTHMLASLSGGGGFGLLTGEVGTGKTTILRALIARLPQETQVAVVLNPALSSNELLATICDELGLEYEQNATFKQLTDAIYQHLLKNHSEGRQTLLLVDEAQHLLPDVLEQLRLLTNLETESTKLLKVVLVGQPELQQLLQQDRLRQLAQRITSRYHLLPLTEQEVTEYIYYRLHAVNCIHEVFSPALCRHIARATQGIPRLINLVCDKAMYIGSQNSAHMLTKSMVTMACDEVLSWQMPTQSAQIVQASTASPKGAWLPTGAAVLTGTALAIGLWLYQAPLTAQLQGWLSQPDTTQQQPVLAVQPEHQASSAASEQMVAAPVVSRWQQVLELQPSKRQAMQALYQLWGYSTTLNQANCETSQRVQLSCHQSRKGELTQLSLINRPAILTLEEPDALGLPYYAVLYAFEQDRVQLLIGGERIEVERDWLETRWLGEFELLWRPPLGEKSTIRFGQQGPRVRWLNQQLSLLLGEQDNRSDSFDQTLLEKLRRFQRAQDLTADGIAGPNTLMLLDAALELPGPTLQQEQG